MRKYVLAAFVGGCSVAQLGSGATIYSTGFEAPTFAAGPITTNPLVVGQDGWSIDDNTVSASVITGSVGAGTTFQGNQALRIIPTPPSTSYTFRPTPVTPTAQQPVISAKFAMKIEDGTVRSTAWGGTAFDSGINTVIAQALVTNQGAIVAQNGLVGFPVSAAGLVQRNVWNTIELRMNYSTLRYRVLLNDVPVTFTLLGQQYVDLEINPGDGIFGELDYQNTTVAGANDAAIFDSHSIVMSVVPEPASLSLITVAVAGVGRRRRAH